MGRAFLDAWNFIFSPLFWLFSQDKMGQNWDSNIVKQQFIKWRWCNMVVVARRRRKRMEEKEKGEKTKEEKEESEAGEGFGRGRQR